MHCDRIIRLHGSILNKQTGVAGCKCFMRRAGSVRPEKGRMNHEYHTQCHQGRHRIDRRPYRAIAKAAGNSARDGRRAGLPPTIRQRHSRLPPGWWRGWYGACAIRGAALSIRTNCRSMKSLRSAAPIWAMSSASIPTGRRSRSGRTSFRNNSTGTILGSSAISACFDP